MGEELNPRFFCNGVEVNRTIGLMDISHDAPDNILSRKNISSITMRLNGHGCKKFIDELKSMRRNLSLVNLYMLNRKG